MDYGEVLSKSWKIIWKHKILWVFGILASCGANGGGGGGNSGYRFSGSGSNSSGNLPGFERQFNQLTHFFEQIPAWVYIAIAIFVLVLILVVAFLSTLGRIGLIKGAIQADEGDPKLTFGALFSASLTYFWRVFFLNLFVGLAIFALFILLFIPVIVLGVVTKGIGLLAALPLLLIGLCLLIPLSWAVSLIIEQSNVAIVAEDLGILTGLKRGWNVVIHHIGPMILMALILILGAGIVGLLIALPMVAIVVPPIVGFAMHTSGAIRGGIIVAVILFLIYLPVLLVLSGIVRAYVGTAWTLTFRRLTGTKAVEPVTPIDEEPAEDPLPA